MGIAFIIGGLVGLYTLYAVVKWSLDKIEEKVKASRNKKNKK